MLFHDLFLLLLKNVHAYRQHIWVLFFPQKKSQHGDGFPRLLFTLLTLLLQYSTVCSTVLIDCLHWVNLAFSYFLPSLVDARSHARTPIMPPKLLPPTQFQPTALLTSSLLAMCSKYIRGSPSRFFCFIIWEDSPNVKFTF